MSRRPTATVLKLIRGDKNTSRFKDDRPKIDSLPVLPPNTTLTADEQLMWDWLIANVYMPGIHGTSDGAAFLKVARLYTRVASVDAKIAQFGLIMKSPTGRPELQPYTRLSRDLWHQIGIALAEIGATPVGRVKLAGPRKMGEPTSWDQID